MWWINQVNGLSILAWVDLDYSVVTYWSRRDAPPNWIEKTQAYIVVERLILAIMDMFNDR
jgi:hypothetical protein